MEGRIATDDKTRVRLLYPVLCTYRTMEVQQTSNLRIIVRLYVGVRNASQRIPDVLPRLKANG